MEAQVPSQSPTSTNLTGLRDNHSRGKAGEFLMEKITPGSALSFVSAFLEDLIDACVMECYFREHMAERDLLFHDTVAPHLAAYAPEASAARQRDFLTHLHQTLNAPSHPIRNRLLRLTADSPELLAIIKQEGKV